MNVASQPGPRWPLDQESLLTPVPENDVRERGWPFFPALELLARSIESCHKLGDRGDRPEILVGHIRGTKLNGELRFQKADETQDGKRVQYANQRVVIAHASCLERRVASEEVTAYFIFNSHRCVFSQLVTSAICILERIAETTAGLCDSFPTRSASSETRRWKRCSAPMGASATSRARRPLNP